LAAALAYLACLLTLSYVVWGPWEGVDPRTRSWWVYLLVAVFHVLCGLVIARWWAVGLPLVWAAASIGAGGYDTPIALVIAFQTLFIWGPALAAGVAAGRAGPRLRWRGGRHGPSRASSGASTR